MIARNLLKYAEALALQLPLPWGRRMRRLKLARPTTSAGRAARAARAAVRRAALAVRVIYPARRQPAPKRPVESSKAQQLALFWIKLDGWEPHGPIMRAVRVWAYA